VPCQHPARTLPALAAALAASCAVVLAACGTSDPTTAATPKGTVVTGPGVRAAAPPFAPDYTKLPQRIRLLGLPPTGKEKYHVHALMRIYQDGILVPVPANVGVDEKRKVIAPIHTHDATGVLHFESDKPFSHTLGDVFEVWGLTLGPGQVGALKDGDGQALRVYVNGRRIDDPASYAIRKNDVIVMRFDDGSQNVPLNPDTTALKDANAGKGLCGSAKGKKTTSCTLMKKPA
jgi:hypothetical protein